MMMRRAATNVVMTVGLLGLGCTSNSAPQEPAPAVAAAEAVEPEKSRVPAPVEAKPPATHAVVETPAPEVPAVEATTAVGPGLHVVLPAVDDAKAPAVVFAAQVDTEHGQWAVDIVDLAGLDAHALGAKLEAHAEAEQDEEEGGGRLALKAGDAALPKGFAVGDPWTLITSGGAEHRSATSFDAVVMEGSGDMHFYVQLGKASKKAKGPRLALRGHVDLEAAKLTVPKATELDAEVLARVVTAIKSGVEKELEDEDEAAEFSATVRAIEIGKSDVQAFEGRFPGERTHVVFVKTTPSEDSDDGVMISGVVFVKADGSAELLGVAGVWGYVELFGLLDVNGDGFHEVFYEDGYHEGWYLQMIQWAGEKPAERMITGDGV